MKDFREDLEERAAEHVNCYQHRDDRLLVKPGVGSGVWFCAKIMFALSAVISIIYLAVKK